MKEKQAFINYRLEKANETLAEIDVMIENKLWNFAVNRLYYACYYAVSALLLDKDIVAKTHAGTNNQFGLHIVNAGIIDQASGKFYTSLFTMRQRGDYDDFVDFDEERVMTLLEPAKKFVADIEKVLTKNGTIHS